jgi:hypothetical protein
MLNYLYYKLYQASLKSSLKDIPEFMTSISFGGLISVNTPSCRICPQLKEKMVLFVAGICHPSLLYYKDL